MAKFNLTAPKAIRVVSTISQVIAGILLVDLDTGTFSVSINDGVNTGPLGDVRVSGTLNNGQLASLTNAVEAAVGSFLGTTAAKAP